MLKILRARTKLFNAKYADFFDVNRVKGLSQTELKKQAAARTKALNALKEDSARLAEKTAIRDSYQEKLDYIVNLLK